MGCHRWDISFCICHSAWAKVWICLYYVLSVSFEYCIVNNTISFCSFLIMVARKTNCRYMFAIATIPISRKSVQPFSSYKRQNLQFWRWPTGDRKTSSAKRCYRQTDGQNGPRRCSLLWQHKEHITASNVTMLTMANKVDTSNPVTKVITVSMVTMWWCYCRAWWVMTSLQRIIPPSLNFEQPSCWYYWLGN